MNPIRIFLTGVGGQGTLTATNLLAKIAMEENIPVTAGEIHGMAQRGGVVESTVLLGGYLSPKISHSEADILLGFEILETLRALPYLAKGGSIISSSESITPIGVAMGRETAPDLEQVRNEIIACQPKTRFVPCLSLAEKAGSIQAANMVLLGALFAAPDFPIPFSALEKGIRSHLKPKLVEMNLLAIELGARALKQQQKDSDG